jgi:hypothetical protein
LLSSRHIPHVSGASTILDDEDEEEEDDDNRGRDNDTGALAASIKP